MAPPFTITGKFNAKCVSVHDGDTLTAEMYFRQKTPETFRIRLLHINAPETRVRKTVENREEVKKAGFAAKYFLENRILGEDIVLHCEGLDSFGRILADVYCAEQNMNQLMLDSGHAIPFH